MTQLRRLTFLAQSADMQTPPTQPPFPFYAALSLAMAALAIISTVASFMRPMTGLGVVLLSVFGPTSLGFVFAAVGIRNQEQPKKFPVIGLIANAAIPVAFIALAALAGAGLASWHD